MKTFTPPIGQPVRFVALEWREAWEFDHPSVVLEPVFQYSPNGEPAESMIDDAITDILCDHDSGKPTRADIHPAERREFEWRGWSIDELRSKAEACLRGERVEFGQGLLYALEQHVVFSLDEGVLEAEIIGD